MLRSSRVLVLALAAVVSVLWHSGVLLPRAPDVASAHGPRTPPTPPASPPPAPAPPPRPKRTTFQRAFRPSKHALDLQGYNVFDSLYLASGKLAYAPASGARARKLERADILSGEVELADKRWEQLADGRKWFEEHKGERGVRVVQGTTVLLNDEPGPSGYLVYHSHFYPEVLLPALRALSAALPAREDAPVRVWLPRVQDVVGEQGWKDAEGKNEELVKLLLGEQVEIVTSSEWDTLATSGETVVFERVVIVDRWAAHRHPATHKWNKMNSALVDLPAPAPGKEDWFVPYRTNALAALGVEDGEGEKEVVVYMDRNRPSLTPRLSDAAHKSLIAALRSLATRSEIHLTIPSNLSLRERVGLCARAKVLLGARSDDFVGCAGWMPAGGTVLELVSEIQGLEHLAVHPTRLIPRPTWLTLEQKRGPDWDATDLTVDAALVVRKLRDVLGLD